MEMRKFGIPAIALGFTALTLTGCPVDDDDKDDEDEDSDTDSDSDSDTDSGAAIDGSWSLTSLTAYGESYPLEYTYEYDGYTYTNSTAISMDITSPSVDLTMASTYYTDNPEYSYDNGEESYSYSGTVTDSGGGTYGIDVTDNITMDCSLSGDTLSCAGTSDYSGLDLEWSR